MAYLRVECTVCKTHWNYYEEMYEPYPKTTPVQYQGCVCPRCGAIGYFLGTASSKSLGGSLFLGDRREPHGKHE